MFTTPNGRVIITSLNNRKQQLQLHRRVPGILHLSAAPMVRPAAVLVTLHLPYITSHIRHHLLIKITSKRSRARGRWTRWSTGRATTTSTSRDSPHTSTAKVEVCAIRFLRFSLLYVTIPDDVRIELKEGGVFQLNHNGLGTFSTQILPFDFYRNCAAFMVHKLSWRRPNELVLRQQHLTLMCGSFINSVSGLRMNRLYFLGRDFIL